MNFIADLHIHSHHSMATSKNLRPEYLEYWSRIKGIKVVGTGDFSHPAWLKELKEKLEPAEEGLYKLKTEFKLPNLVPETPENEVRFILSAEISNIYKKKGQVRKIHSIILSPSFETVERIQEKLSGMNFNITSDGRPILGLDVRDLLEITLDTNENNFFIPAHIWTPWFSVFGSKSGFNSMEECFEDLSGHIHAVETGLSTDPPMNWMCSFLDKYTLISNSDAHSPEKLGRNANFFKSELSYKGITRALKAGDPEKFGGTFDMFPQEGKYHYDGHRKCGIRWSPVDTLKHRGICPVCGKKVTVGVTNRVVELSDREDITQKENRLPFFSIIPLKEMLAEIEGVGEKSKKISRIYETLIKKAGSEFNLLHFLPLDDVAPIAGEVLTEGIRRMRSHEVSIKEGYDGEYGEVNVFQPDEVKYLSTQESLFEDTTRFKKNEKQKLINFDLSEYRKLEHLYSNKSIAAEEPANYEKPHSETLEGLNPQQMNATTHLEGTAAVMAGPGTGKTRVLTRRIAWLIKEQRILPDQILAITFTNKAAEEMQQRCNTLLKTGNTGKSPNISTFHAFGYQVIDQHRKLTGLREGFSIMDETNQVDFMANLFQISKKEAKRLGRKITTLKQEMTDLKDIQDDQLKEAFERYNEKLMQYNLVDLDDLICLPVKMLQEHQSLQKEMHQKHPWILVDEFQDINYMQYLLLQLLTNQSENPNLYVIGDPNQAIYGFRGSSTRFISRLISDYKETQVHKLHTSYRCSNQILKASGNILQQDALEGLNDGVKIKIAPQTTDKSEAEYIARTIEQLSGGLRFFSMDSNVTQGEGAEEIESLSDFAILCRTKAQMKIIEKALLDHTIPYQLIAEDTFFHHPTVQLIRDILELSVNPANQFLQLKLNELDLDFQSLIKNLQTIENVQDKTSHIVSHLNDDQLLDKELIPKINQLTRQYGNQTHEFLQYLTIGKGQDIYEKETEKVTVMTLHASKGLEFKCVFIAGCENGLIPYSFFPNQEIDKEEEERLLYVGMTRAQSYLYLTHAKKRFLMGKEQEMQRSPFLNRIEKSLMEIEKNACRKKQKDDKQLKLF